MKISGNSQGSIAALQRSKTGQKLLAEAEKRGVNIEFKANNGDNTLGQYNPNNNTVTVESGNIEKMVETLAHELVHANTRENGNSMNEEKAAFKIGEQVAEEAGVNYNKHTASFWDNHVDKSYSGLKDDNGILSSLYALGLASNGQSSLTDSQRNAIAAGNAGNNFDFVTPNAAANNATPTAAANNATPAANNPMQNGQNPMMGMMAGMFQMFMQMMQMIMQMMMQMQNGQQQNNNQNAQSPFADFENPQKLMPAAAPFSLTA